MGVFAREFVCMSIREFGAFVLLVAMCWCVSVFVYVWWCVNALLCGVRLFVCVRVFVCVFGVCWFDVCVCLVCIVCFVCVVVCLFVCAIAHVLVCVVALLFLYFVRLLRCVCLFV